MLRPTGALLRGAYLVLLGGLFLQTWLLYQPPSPHPEPAHWDKVVHALMFGCPAALALILGMRWAPLLFAWYAPVSELIQATSFIGRDADIHDAVADITGIVLLCAVVTVWQRRHVR